MVAARPNFMKAAPIAAEMARRGGEFETTLVHTGQHYDDAMSRVFFEELGLPRPEIDLGVGSGSHAEQTARVMLAFEPVLTEHQPDWVVVVGDVNSTLAVALTAAKLGTRVAHVEAGLRSNDRAMPEEHNRILTDHLADALFTHCREADDNLIREGISPGRIHFVGNVMIDSLVRILPAAERRSILANMGLLDGGGHPDSYVLVTLHRPSNVDDPATLLRIVRALRTIADEVPVVFPVHPRTRARMADLGLDHGGEPTGLRLVDPLGYLDFLALERHAAVVVTDSGGIQEETTYLGVPCLTVRANTERPITISQGTNRLVGSDPSVLLQAVRTAIESNDSPSAGPPPLWDGRAAQRIVDVLAELP